MLPMAYLGRLLTTWVPQERIRSFRVSFVAPTPVDAALSCRVRVTRTELVDGERRARVVLTTALADGTTVVRGEASIALADHEDLDGKDTA
jgi:acyl dehydratase